MKRHVGGRKRSDGRCFCDFGTRYTGSLCLYTPVLFFVVSLIELAFFASSHVHVVMEPSSAEFPSFAWIVLSRPPSLRMLGQCWVEVTHHVRYPGRERVRLPASKHSACPPRTWRFPHALQSPCPRNLGTMTSSFFLLWALAWQTVQGQTSDRKAFVLLCANTTFTSLRIVDWPFRVAVHRYFH